MKTLLFFGDSITDMMRNRGDENSYDRLGVGYPSIIQSKLFEKFGSEYKVINKGISGDRTVDLYARIKKDVWNYKPDVLTIFIGVNDVWHEWFCQNEVDIDRFERTYEEILRSTKIYLPNTEIILMTPFILQGSASNDFPKLLTEVPKYADVVKKLADKHNLKCVDLQSQLNNALSKADFNDISIDGVHPNIGGATVIANAWINTFIK